MGNDFRITLTKRMLKEGLIRIMSQKTLSKITVSELCTAAGVNRTTFYNHYESPTMVLKEISEDYASNLNEIFTSKGGYDSQNHDTAIEACLDYLYSKKEEIKVLFSSNAENRISGFGLDIVMQQLKENKSRLSGSDDEAFIYAIITSSASFGLIQMWLTTDLDKTPKELTGILRRIRERMMFQPS